MKSWNNGNFVVNPSEKGIIFENFPKIGSFFKNAIEWKVMTQMFCNFFYKIWTECSYEKCPRTWFLVKNWSKYDYVKHAKIKKTPCRLGSIFASTLAVPKNMVRYKSDPEIVKSILQSINCTRRMSCEPTILT